MIPVAPSPPRDTSLKKGAFLVFEGIDGAGKTTQMRRLVERLSAAGWPVVSLKEPTDGPWGQKARAIARHGRVGVSLEDELEYYIRDREEDVRLNIDPALASRRVVIVDRYFYSNIAYQAALGLEPGEIRRRNAAFPVPDLVFLLEISPALSQTRITRHRKEAVNTGYEQEEFLEKVKAGYDRLTDPNLVRLSSDAPKDEVAETIWNHVSTLLTRLGG